MDWLGAHRLALITVWALLNTRNLNFFDNAGLYADIGLLAYLTVTSWDHILTLGGHGAVRQGSLGHSPLRDNLA